MNLAKAIVESMPKPQDTIKPRWATVVSVVPLRIRFDGEDNPLNLTPVDLVGVSLNDRVWCQLYAGQVFIIGIKDGLPQKAFGIMYKTNGFQASTTTESPVTLESALCLLVSNLGSDATIGHMTRPYDTRVVDTLLSEGLGRIKP